MLKFLSALFGANKPPRLLTEEQRRTLCGFMESEKIPQYDPREAPEQDHESAGDIINIVNLMKVLLDRGIQRASYSYRNEVDDVVAAMIAAGAVGRGLRRVFGAQQVVGDATAQLFIRLCDWANVPDSIRGHIAGTVSAASDALVKIPGVGSCLRDIEMNSASAVGENLQCRADATVTAIAEFLRLMRNIASSAEGPGQRAAS